MLPKVTSQGTGEWGAGEMAQQVKGLVCYATLTTWVLSTAPMLEEKN